MSDHRFDPLDRLAELFPDPGLTIERLKERRARVRRRRAVVGGATATFGFAGVAVLLAATTGFGGSDTPRAVSSAVDSVTATAPPAAGPNGLVTEEVEPGVERIISDDAGHDLDERDPNDMDNVAVTPDGNVWLWTGFHDSDSEADSYGGFLWALGQPGETTLPDFFCLSQGGVGVLCIDPVRVEGEDTTYRETTYLPGTPINAVSVAPDGTVWAVGDYDGENGGLYRITHEPITR